MAEQQKIECWPGDVLMHQQGQCDGDRLQYDVFGFEQSTKQHIQIVNAQAQRSGAEDCEHQPPNPDVAEGWFIPGDMINKVKY